MKRSSLFLVTLLLLASICSPAYASMVMEEDTSTSYSLDDDISLLPEVLPGLPMIEAGIRWYQGPQVRGAFIGETEDMHRVEGMYSLDGIDYIPITKDYDSSGSSRLAIYATEYPLNDYLSFKIDKFYVRYDFISFLEN